MNNQISLPPFMLLMNNYPHAFLKREGDIVIASVRLSVRPSVMLSPPKPLDEIQPNLVSELLTWMGRATSNFFLAPPPGALGRGQNVKYQLISISKSISKNFIPNFVCVLTNERYKTYQTGFLFCSLGHAPGVGLWGAGGAQGAKKLFFKHGHVVYQINGDDEQNRMQVKFSS